MQTSGVSVLNETSVSHDAIEHRAYEIYEQSGCIQGQCDQNWALAERDMQKQSRGGA